MPKEVQESHTWGSAVSGVIGAFGSACYSLLLQGSVREANTRADMAGAVARHEHQGRIAAEADRDTEREARVAAEADRETAEADRDTEREARVAAEADRDTEREVRVAAEADRDTEREARVAAEADRDTEREAKVAAEVQVAELRAQLAQQQEHKRLFKKIIHFILKGKYFLMENNLYCSYADN